MKGCIGELNLRNLNKYYFTTKYISRDFDMMIPFDRYHLYTENHRKSYRNPREIIPLSRCSNVVQTLLKRYGMVQPRVNIECSLSMWYYLGLFTALFGLDLSNITGIFLALLSLALAKLSTIPCFPQSHWVRLDSVNDVLVFKQQFWYIRSVVEISYIFFFGIYKNQ